MRCSLLPNLRAVQKPARLAVFDEKVYGRERNVGMAAGAISPMPTRGDKEA